MCPRLQSILQCSSGIPFLARASSGIAALTSPERITSMGNIVREMPDALGVLQLGGSSPFAHNFGGGLPSPSSIRAQQQYQHMLKMQLQQQVRSC